MPDSVADLRRKYADTWVQHGGRPVMVLDFRGTDNFPLAVAADPDMPDGTLSIPLRDLNLKFPTLGCINLGQMAVHVVRAGARQWKWGLALTNISHTYLAQQATYIAGIKDGTRDTPAFLSAVFNPQYPSFEEAYARVVGGDAAACAFTNRLWLGVDLYSDAPVVGYKQWIVGRAQPNGKVRLRQSAAPIKEMIQLYREVV